MTRAQALELSAGLILLGGAIGVAAYWSRPGPAGRADVFPVSRPATTDQTKIYRYSYAMNQMLTRPNQYIGLPWAVPDTFKGNATVKSSITPPATPVVSGVTMVSTAICAARRCSGRSG